VNKTGWISVKKRMPPLDKEVLVVYKDVWNNQFWMDVMTLYPPYGEGGELRWDSGDDEYKNEVRYWMPLPEMPEFTQEDRDV
jgi:hypothetical protein